MLRFIFAGLTRVCYFLGRYAPGPRLISRIRRRDSLKWGVPAMLLALPYFFIADLLKTLIEGGGSLWLSLPLLWCLVMGITFVVLGPVTAFLLIVARSREALESRHSNAGR